ncbi:MAG: 50S ribosomal protein L7/L12 [Bifidobacteriaceae bacterium]|jgi:large subunit ribosomal protein L7/L12|nr:50S ribosomal protein L7/L12 [Bifidobacteriaceae bacterium]
MAKLTIDELIEQFKQLSLIELADFVKKFEEVFEVTAAAPAAGAVAAPAQDAGEAEAEPEDEQSEFDVILENYGEKKAQVIRVVHKLTGIRLLEAKALVDEAPKPILEKVNKETAEKAKADLEEAGGTVTLK